MNDLGFWEQLEKPIVGLSPMDGVTDAAFRYMIAKHSSPSLMMTEFTNVEGLARGATKMLTAFKYDEIERPIVAQIYGVEVDSFYKCAVMLCAMGFDGVDINMGCPANKVARKGSGAGLIQTPELAKEIIRACKKGALDWANGISLEEAGVHEDIIAAVDVWGERVIRPVSVKTRIGFDKDISVEWVKHLVEERPANISMHGRTLKQMYLGEADWEAISRAGEVCRAEGISYLGNGDVLTMEQARRKCEEYCVDGVLIGRGTMGAPWFFGGQEPSSVAERMEILLEHCRYFVGLELWPFYAIKKHLAWYCKEFAGAREMRLKLMRTSSMEEVETVVEDFLNNFNGEEL